ncbi:MAG: glycosyltransferase family 39 protein [Actinobacteria bacterium]|nr:glycosyltransferase family 39 protein [Actinomycetota bacterium]
MRQGGALLVCIVLLGIGLRFATLGVQSFSDDELFTAWLVKMPLGDMLSTIPRSERTPYLFYLVEWAGARLFGTGEAGLRVLPAVFGAATVPVIYLAGAIGASRRVGLVAALFAAVSPFLIWYSQEARSYAQLILLVAISFAFLIAYARARTGRALAGWAVASALAVATHYFALFLVLPEAAWVVARGGGRPNVRVLFAAVPAAMTAALVPLMLHQRGAVGDKLGGAGRSVVERLVAIPKNFLVGFAIPFEAVASALAGLAAAVAVWLALRAARGDELNLARAAGALTAAGIAVPLVLALLGFDYLQSRNTVATLVPVAIVLGVGFVAGRLGTTALVILCIVSIVTYVGVASERRYQRRDWRGAAQELGPARTSRLVVFSPPFSNLGPFRIYYGRGTRDLPRAVPRVREIASIALAQFKGFGPGAYNTPSGPAPRAPRGFRLVQIVRTSTYRLVRFQARHPLAPTAAELLGVVFDHAPSVVVWQPGGRR